MTDMERFSYSGPATINGADFPNVLLTEQPPEDGMRSWTGTTSFTPDSTPDDFALTLGGIAGAVPMTLPDGRSARVIIDNIQWNGRDHYTVDLTGVGPAPGMAD